MLFVCFIKLVGSNTDFDSAPQTVTIIAGTNSSTIIITVINDNIVEGNETFNMSFTLPSSLGPGITTGSITNATATIIDTSSKLCTLFLVVVMHCCDDFADITVRFTQNLFTGSEARGFVLVHLELTGGTSAYPFSVTVTPLEQSPVSAEGNSLMFIINIDKRYFTNRWC